MTVVSDVEKARKTRQVGIGKASGSDSLLTCRKRGSPDVDVDRGACGMRRRVGGAAGELGART